METLDKTHSWTIQIRYIEKSVSEKELWGTMLFSEQIQSKLVGHIIYKVNGIPADANTYTTESSKVKSIKNGTVTNLTMLQT